MTVKQGEVGTLEIANIAAASMDRFEMPWDTIWLFIQSQAPSLEVVGTFVALAAAILLMPRIAGIGWSWRVVLRDLALLTFFAAVSVYLIGQEPQSHWMQRLSNWLQSFF